MQKNIINIIVSCTIICICIGFTVFAFAFFGESRLLILADYEYVSFSEKDIKLKETDVQEKIKDKLSNYVIAKDRTVVRENYLVVIDYVSYVNGIMVSKKYDQAAIVGSGFFGKEFEAELIDSLVGDNLTFDIIYPSDYHDSALAGKKYRFDVVIHRSVEYVYPELNDDFVKSNLGYDSSLEFQCAVENELREEIKQDVFNKNKKQIFSELIAHSTFYIREKDIVTRYEELIDYYAVIASYQNMDVYTYAYHVMQMSKSEFIEFCKQESEQYVKSVMVASKIAQKEGIEIFEDDISEYCYNNNVFYEGEEPSDYLLNLVLIDKVQDFILD